MPDTASWRGDPALAEQAEQERAKYRASLLEVADAQPPDFSDEALAIHFATKHQADARYVAAWKRWLLWNGTRWQVDNTMLAFNLARTVARVASGEAEGHTARSVASHKTVAAIVALARADQRLAATVEQWDADPLSVNTPGQEA